MNKNFIVNAFNRSLIANGRTFIYKRQSVDDYEQPIKNMFVDVDSFVGIYHEPTITTEINNYQGNSGDKVYSKKPDYKITCLVKDIFDYTSNEYNLKINDFFIINNNRYIVTAIKDISNLGVIAEISLKVEFVNDAV